MISVVADYLIMLYLPIAQLRKYSWVPLIIYPIIFTDGGQYEQFFKSEHKNHFFAR
jgi:hypothetical protein